MKQLIKYLAAPLAFMGAFLCAAPAYAEGSFACNFNPNPIAQSPGIAAPSASTCTNSETHIEPAEM